MKRHRTDDELTATMLDVLNYSKGWHTRSGLRRCIHLTPRECRRARANGKGAIIFGQAGYRLTRYASETEAVACLKTIRSMADKLREQYETLRTVMVERWGAE